MWSYYTWIQTDGLCFIEIAGYGYVPTHIDSLGQVQLDPSPSWLLLVQFVLTADFNHSSPSWFLAHLDSWPILTLGPSWPLAHFDSWPILTLLFVYFLMFTVSSTLSGGKQQQPILTLGPFWTCHLFLSCCSLLVRPFQRGGGKQQQPIVTLGPSWLLAHFDSWLIVTLLFVSFLLFTVSLALLWVSNSSPSWPLAHFDPAICLFLAVHC